jgi:large subunit ribosomal protein L29
MEIERLRTLSVSELKEKEAELRKKLLDLRFKRAGGGIKNVMEVRETRRAVARVLTLINEKEKSGD